MVARPKFGWCGTTSNVIWARWHSVLRGDDTFCTSLRRVLGFNSTQDVWRKSLDFSNHKPSYGRLAYVSSFMAEPLPGSRIHGYDRPQYAFDAQGVPDAVVAAVHQGFGIILSDFDCRQIEWTPNV